VEGREAEAEELMSRESLIKRPSRREDRISFIIASFSRMAELNS